MLPARHLSQSYPLFSIPIPFIIPIPMKSSSKNTPSPVIRTLKKLETAGYLLLIGLSAFLLIRQLSGSDTPASAASAPQAPKAGDKLEALAELVPQGATSTLVLALSPDCPHCKRSIAFYRELSPQLPHGLNAIFSPPYQEAQLKKLFADSAIQARQVQEVDFQALGIRGIPTLLHIDQNGTVLDAWEGYLKAEKQAEIYALLTQSGASQ